MQLVSVSINRRQIVMMKLLTALIFEVLFLTLVPSASFAQSPYDEGSEPCNAAEGHELSVIYLNGIWNTLQQAQDSGLKLANAELPALANRSVEFCTFWNVGNGRINDLIETTLLASEDLGLMDRLPAVENFIHASLTKEKIGFRSTSSGTALTVKGLTVAEIVSLGNYLGEKRAALHRNPTFLSSTHENINRMYVDLVALLRVRKVIIVAHSEGNMFATNLWDRLEQESNTAELRSRLQIIHVAPPENIVSDHYVSSNVDRVMELSRAAGHIGVPRPTDELYSFSEGDDRGWNHGFVTTYLTRRQFVPIDRPSYLECFHGFRPQINRDPFCDLNVVERLRSGTEYSNEASRGFDIINRLVANALAELDQVPSPDLPRLPIDSYFFNDEFIGTQLDASIWDTSQAISGMRWCDSIGFPYVGPGEWRDPVAQGCNGTVEANEPYGSIVVANGAATFSSDKLRTFPYVWRGDAISNSPFPNSERYTIEIRAQFNEFGGSGSGIKIREWADSQPAGNNPSNVADSAMVLRVWASSFVSVELFGVEEIVEPRDSYHVYRLEYDQGMFSLYVDDQLRIGPMASPVRPNSILIGNPVHPWAFPSNWIGFSVDYIRVTDAQVPDTGGGNMAPPVTEVQP